MACARIDDGGYAIVKEPASGSFLGITAGYHSKTHKQSDDLSFDLYERGHRVVSDTGRYHSDADRFKEFDQSNKAHSTLVVDGEPFPQDGERTYGSGIRDSGQGDGWYAIWAKNPLVGAQDVRHRRLLLYRPAEALVVFDELRSDRRHSYKRYFHLGPDIDIAEQPDVIGMQASGFLGSLRADGTSRTTVRGRNDPLLGWTFPSFRQSIPRWTITYRSERSDANHVAGFGLDGRSLRVDVTSANDTRTKLQIRRGAQESEVTVVEDGGSLVIHERPAL
jgi:hypothetical protein